MLSLISVLLLQDRRQRILSVQGPASLVWIHRVAQGPDSLVCVHTVAQTHSAYNSVENKVELSYLRLFSDLLYMHNMTPLYLHKHTCICAHVCACMYTHKYTSQVGVHLLQLLLEKKIFWITLLLRRSKLPCHANTRTAIVMTMRL